MKLSFSQTDVLQTPAPLLAVGVAHGTETPTGFLARVDEHLGGVVSRLLADGDFKGRGGDEAVLYGGGEGPARFVLIGTGKAEKFDAEQVRQYAGSAVRAAERLDVMDVALWVDGAGAVEDGPLAQAAAEGLAMAAWRFMELKSEPADDEARPEIREATLYVAGDAAALAAGTEAGAIIGRGANLARTLQSRPGNVATPTHLADEATRMGAEVGLTVTAFDEARLLEEGMHAILTVSQGSEEEARLIIMEHNGGQEGDPPLILVGKGLTFDAGGISIKPALGMEDMKFDMSGGAAVIGAMQAIAELGVKANVVGIVPSSENLLSGKAVKPGDIIQTLGGKTVEVINTDAEGRLILADALAYGARMKPAAMVDCATLTGAVVIALGGHAIGLMSNDDDLAAELRGAGDRSGERCWQLPLWPEYTKQLDSTTADLMNVGGRPAGSITAAAFLQEFVGDATWAHLDIAGTAYGDGKLSYQRKGGYGLPARLLVEWVRSRAG
jgi:leucyl aminopeptidase